MDVNELKERYKEIRLWKRLSLVAVFCILPSAYHLYEKSLELDAQIAAATAGLDDSNRKFAELKRKSKGLDAEEQQVVQYEKDLVQARKMLPDVFLMDDILHSTATEAITAGLDLKLFDPQDMVSVRRNVEQKWQALPISLRTSGTYQQVARFFDSILHFDKLIHFESITMRGLAQNDGSGERVFNRNSERPTLDATAEMLIYASIP